MDSDKKKGRIAWYRSPIDRETLEVLNRRSDWKGALQTFGYLGLLVLTGALAWFAAGRLPLAVVLLILFAHGTFWAFLSNGFHEFCHKSVFKTKTLNTVFLYIFSFMGWYNPVLFWASHQEHHKYTLHPPDDLEVVLPVKLTLWGFLRSAFANPVGLYIRLKEVIRLSLGKLNGDWENALFPESASEKRRQLFTWARILLIGHGLLTGVSLYLGLWQLPVLITLAPFYGNGLQYLCNNMQHVGLQDDVEDFRLCCRTVILNPFLSFVYWRMNYHTEHHMFAAVPCYNLAKLHEAIKSDLPYSPVGLVPAWKEIIAILRKQKADPRYEYIPELPTPVRVAV